jgi:predicted nucleotidyltransferase
MTSHLQMDFRLVPLLGAPVDLEVKAAIHRSKAEPGSANK